MIEPSGIVVLQNLALVRLALNRSHLTQYLVTSSFFLAASPDNALLGDDVGFVATGSAFCGGALATGMSLAAEDFQDMLVPPSVIRKREKTVLRLKGRRQKARHNKA